MPYIISFTLEFKVTADYLLETGVTDPTTFSIHETEESFPTSNDISKEIDKLPPESKEELKKLIELYKIRNMQKEILNF